MSALHAVATLGVAASTLAVAKDAGVAEGTFFRYFPTKDELLNTLYLDLKSDLIACLTRDLPAKENTRGQFRHLWDRYIDWGLESPYKHEALRQLEVSHKISDATQRASQSMSHELQDVLEKGFETKALRVQPPLYLWGVIQGIAGLVLGTIAADPAKTEDYTDLGWETLWGAIASHER